MYVYPWKRDTGSVTENGQQAKLVEQFDSGAKSLGPLQRAKWSAGTMILHIYSAHLAWKDNGDLYLTEHHCLSNTVVVHFLIVQLMSIWRTVQVWRHEQPNLS